MSREAAALAPGAHLPRTQVRFAKQIGSAGENLYQVKKISSGRRDTSPHRATLAHFVQHDVKKVFRHFLGGWKVGISLKNLHRIRQSAARGVGRH